MGEQERDDFKKSMALATRALRAAAAREDAARRRRLAAEHAQEFDEPPAPPIRKPRGGTR